MPDDDRIVRQLELLNAKLGSGEQRSSAAISTSTRGWDITIKVYEGGQIEDVTDAAIDQYWRAYDRMVSEATSRGQMKAA